MIPVLLLAAFFQPEATRSQVTTEEVAAVFLQNAMRAETLRVEWLVSRKATEEARRRHAGAIQEFHRMLKVCADDNERLKLENFLEQAKAGIVQSSAENDLYCQMDYWTDRRNFQARCPHYKQRGGPFCLGDVDLISFPSGEAIGDRLRNDFGNIHITSCGEATDQVFRVWEGKEIFDGVQAAYLQSSERRDVTGFYPPLSLPQKQWLGAPHIIDTFYQMVMQGEASILGRVVIDGTETLLVQSSLNRRTVRGFVDLNQGALPIRVEMFLSDPPEKFHSLFDSHVDVCEKHPKLGPAEICRDIVIKQYEDETGTAFFYPISGLIQGCHLATSPEYALSSLLNFISVHEEKSWEVRDLEINLSMSQENFALAFPEGTLFTNSDTRETYIAGDVSGNAKRFVEGSLAYGPKTPIYKTWTFAMIALFIAGGLLWLGIRWRAAA